MCRALPGSGPAEGRLAAAPHACRRLYTLRACGHACGPRPSPLRAGHQPHCRARRQRAPEAHQGRGRAPGGGHQHQPRPAGVGQRHQGACRARGARALPQHQAHAHAAGARARAPRALPGSSLLRPRMLVQAPVDRLGPASLDEVFHIAELAVPHVRSARSPIRGRADQSSYVT
jgi:hypothetical protein